MRIASFNVNGIRARLPVIIKWLADNQPDVLCIQETKVQDTDFPCDALEESGYKYVFKGQKAYNGVALLSRSPIKQVQFGFETEPREQPRLIKAEINRVFIVNTYVPQGYSPESEKFVYKLNWFERLRRYFEKHFSPKDAVLWVGDLNIAPEPIDVYDGQGLLGHVCFHPEVHKALKKVMNWGFVDVFRLHCKEGGQYTFWDYRLRESFERNLGWRLDHIMATKPLAEKSTACYIDRGPRGAERPSDHTPIVAEFDW